MQKKIVFYGPKGSGKTTIIERIAKGIPRKQRGKLQLLAAGRKVYYEALEITFDENAFSLFTAPGSLGYNRNRVSILRGANAVIFVPIGNDEDHIIMDELKENIHEAGIEHLQIVILENKKRSEVRGKKRRCCNALTGVGIFPALKYTVSLLLPDIANEKTLILKKEEVAKKFGGKVFHMPDEKYPKIGEKT